MIRTKTKKSWQNRNTVNNLLSNCNHYGDKSTLTYSITEGNFCLYLAIMHLATSWSSLDSVKTYSGLLYSLHIKTLARWLSTLTTTSTSASLSHDCTNFKASTSATCSTVSSKRFLNIQFLAFSSNRLRSSPTGLQTKRMTVLITSPIIKICWINLVNHIRITMVNSLTRRNCLTAINTTYTTRRKIIRNYGRICRHLLTRKRDSSTASRCLDPTFQINNPTF